MPLEPVKSDEHDMQERMLELEQELLEFQKSSKELEEALEDELSELENKNKLLVTQINAKDEKLQQLTSQLSDANAEIFRVQEALAADKVKMEKEILALKQKLVEVEILNDDMGMNDRILENNLHFAKLLNNDLLERLALAESDLESEKQINAQYKLRISNLESESLRPLTKARHLQQIKPKSKRQSVTRSIMSVADTTADGTILDLNEFLASAPPEAIHPNSNIPRSGSRGKIHEQYLRSEEIVQKVGQMSQYIGLKSNSTIQVSDHEVQTPPSDKETHGLLVHSPSLANLSKLREELNKVRSPTMPPSKISLHNPSSRNNLQKPRHKKNRIKTVMRFFA